MENTIVHGIFINGFFFSRKSWMQFQAYISNPDRQDAEKKWLEKEERRVKRVKEAIADGIEIPDKALQIRKHPVPTQIEVPEIFKEMIVKASSVSRILCKTGIRKIDNIFKFLVRPVEFTIVNKDGKYGLSIVHFFDQFDRKRGVKIASGRMKESAKQTMRWVP